MANRPTDIQHKKGNQKRIARMQIVSELFLQGYSLRAIANEVAKRLNMEKPPSYSSIRRDEELLLKEWKDERIENFEHNLTIQIQRIENLICELWQAWNSSKGNHKDVTIKQKGVPSSKDGNPQSKVSVQLLEQYSKDIFSSGDARYIAEIRQLLIERAKLFGLYAPNRTEVTGKDGSSLVPEKELDDNKIRMILQEMQVIQP